MDLPFILTGLIVGFCVGVTGVGGGSLMTPTLISILKVEPTVAIGTDLLYASISKFCGSMVHATKLNIIWPLVLWLAIGSIPASLGTTWMLEHYLSDAKAFKPVLTFILGCMLMLTGASIVFRAQIEKWFDRFNSKICQDLDLSNKTQVAECVKRKRFSILLMGIILGIFVTLSSVGAGAFGVMALVVLFPQMPMIRIIGSDVAHAVLLTLVAGLGHLSAGNVDMHILGNLLLGSIPAIIVGTLISSRLPEHQIRRVLGVVLLLLGANFVLHPSKSKPKPVAAPVKQTLPNAAHV